MPPLPPVETVVQLLLLGFFASIASIFAVYVFVSTSTALVAMVVRWFKAATIAPAVFRTNRRSTDDTPF